MKRLLSFALLFMLPLVMTSAALADAKSDKAQQLVDEAIAHYKAVGQEAAYKDFNDKSSKFVDGEFYVIVFTKESIFKTHAINSKLIDNAKLPKLKDVDGVSIVPTMVKAGVDNPNGGWAEYTWTNPTTNKLAKKKTWVREHNDLLFGVGYYE